MFFFWRVLTSQNQNFGKLVSILNFRVSLYWDVPRARFVVKSSIGKYVVCVCVCNICIDVKLLLSFSSFVLSLSNSKNNAGGHRGPGGVGGHRRHPPGTRVNVPALFIGCNVCLWVSYLICMFQDSVPDGSYNDPFLSSVISMVTPTWCHGPT